ncbi:nucleotidyltransferase family protein [Oscillatoria sp. FACHB-1406]|uniref:nucleotidyltransferase domain-containing protein n=1 Tax=Oscillatoria sp. FACHB-1406 TaxID=2692846 RepID=UPI001683668D|nr:nucleotidyltransferase family protein [Oscillatoria sp. FACHB-1406]MBD2576668.1 nucleotidyltransferase family protein [Oscillatoria sp. FACHB-1406]
MPPELELLLCCARTQLTPACKAQIRQLVESKLDWQYLLATAQWHSLTPLLYWQLKTTCPQTVPAEIIEQLSVEFANTLQQNLFLTSQLIKILKKFQERNIIAVPFKGSVLAATLYKNIALRRFHDIDLLIDRKDFFSAREILEAAGYRTKPSLEHRQQQLRLSTNYEQDFFNEKLQVSIDLHWGISPPFFSFNLSLAELLQTDRFLIIAGHRVPVLSPENSLLVLCINGTKEGWAYLQRICDISELICTFPDLDWQELFEKSRQANCLDAVLLGLYLAGELLQAPLPKLAYLELNQHPHLRNYYPSIRQQLFETCSARLKPTHLAYFAWKLQSGLGNKLHFLVKMVLPPNERDLEWISLPQFLFPLYYPLRLLRLISKYGFNGQKKESIQHR